MRRSSTNTRKIIKLAKELSAEVALNQDEKEKELTIQELFDLTWKHHWSQERYQKSGWAQNIRNNFERNIRPHFGTEKLSAITGARVRLWHQSMGEKPIAANRSLETLSRMFRFAEEREIKAQGTNPCALVRSFVERKRKRFATEEEIQGIISILEREKETNPSGVTFLYILLYTGARPRSIERATKKDLKTIIHEGQEYGVLSFNGKTSNDSGEEESVILPPHVMKLICPNLSKSNYNDKLIDTKMPRKLWEKIQKELNCPDLWARDLRRTFATIGLSNGANFGVIGQLLNHKSTQTTSTYAKLIQTEKLNTVKLIGEKLDLITKGRK